MKAQMFIDWAKVHYFIMVAIISAIILCAALLLGYLGPNARKGVVNYAYNCESYSTEPCVGGVQLGQPNTTYNNFDSLSLSTLNGFWSCIVYPYTKNSESVSSSITITVQIWGNNGNATEWTKLVESTQEEVLLCLEGDPLCWGFVVIYENSIRYDKYGIRATFPDTGDNIVVKPLIGDVAFEFQYFNPSYIKEEMSLRVIFLLYTTALIVVYWLKMRPYPISEWLLEQKSLFFLLLGLVCLNNPFFPLEFLVPGGFFPVLDCLLIVIHQSSLFLYWLVVIDYYRKECVQVFTKFDIAKIVTVTVYGIFCFVFFIWFRLIDYTDPTFGQSAHVSAIIVLFFANSILFGSIIVWIILAIALAFKAVKNTRFLARYFAASIPALIIIICIVFGLFFGVFGAIQRNAPSFVFYFTLYNIFVGVLLLFYWPIKTESLSQPVSEATSIFSSKTAENPSDKFYSNNDAL